MPSFHRKSIFFYEKIVNFQQSRFKPKTPGFKPARPKTPFGPIPNVRIQQNLFLKAQTKIHKHADMAVNSPRCRQNTEPLTIAVGSPERLRRGSRLSLSLACGAMPSSRPRGSAAGAHSAPRVSSAPMSERQQMALVMQLTSQTTHHGKRGPPSHLCGLIWSTGFPFWLGANGRWTFGFRRGCLFCGLFAFLTHGCLFSHIRVSRRQSDLE